MKAQILYVEDDETLSFVTKDHLELQDYQVVHCKDGMEGLEAWKNYAFDLCIIDVMLPEMDGFTLAKKIREQDKEVPILFLTAKGMKEDRIGGLQLGADDYITKPFSIEELILRMEVFLKRRKLTSYQSDNHYRLGTYEFDYPNLTIRYGEAEQSLTQREADLLKLLADNKDQVLKRSDILIKLWGEDDYFLGRSLDVFISRLRKYLKEDEAIRIENLHGVGFRMRY